MSPEIVGEIQRLFKLYLDPTSATAEVCLPFECVENTRRRMKYFKAYGPDVFAEATGEPTKALVRDVMPRFMMSERCKQMYRRREERTQELPSSINIPAPKLNNSLRKSGKMKELLTPEAIDEYVNDFNNYCKDVTLYEALLVYLKKMVAAENLLCYRAIDVFEQCVSSAGSTEQGVSTAWMIYRYFLVSGSPYEVSVDPKKLYTISRKMCKPEAGMFDHMKVSLDL